MGGCERIDFLDRIQIRSTICDEPHRVHVSNVRPEGQIHVEP
jgi:hypothetical protein